MSCHEERKEVPREEVPECIRNQYPDQKTFIFVNKPIQVTAAPAPVYTSYPVQSVIHQSPVKQVIHSPVKADRKPAYTQDDVPEEIRKKFPTIGQGFSGHTVTCHQIAHHKTLPEHISKQTQN